MTDLVPLKRKIEEAFLETPYPGDENLIRCPCPECTEIAAYFCGKPWHGHTVRDLRYHSAALSLLTRPAFHYYLPAFVLAELEDPEEADIIYDSLVFNFSPSGSPNYRENIQNLSQAQRAVMVEFLDVCLARYGEYLDDYITKAIAALSIDETPTG